MDRTIIQNGYRLIGLCTLVVLLFTSRGVAQETIWRTLGTVNFIDVYDETIGLEVKKPEFGPWIVALAGQEIEVPGFIIPLEGKKSQSYFMFSALPYDLCFFCGKAGPETAMEVYMAEGKSLAYHPDKITLRGTLELNSTNPLLPIYRIRNAKKID